MVGQNPQHTYRKDGVFYYCRRVPKDLLFKYDETRIVMSLRTKSITAARKSAATITSRLDEYWMSIRIAEMNIPSLLTLETATAGNRQIKISDALCIHSDTVSEIGFAALSFPQILLTHLVAGQQQILAKNMALATTERLSKNG